jgi:hypothetical protein
VSDAWIPGVGHLRTAADGGHLKGGAPRAVWQALGADPAVVSARSAAERLSELGRAGHLIWNPLTGEIVQLVSVLRAGRALGGPEGLAQLAPGSAADSGAKPGSAEPMQADRPAAVNTEGRLCVQVCVVAFVWEPFTAGPMTGLRGILDWLDSWGLSRRWPAGPPVAYPRGQAGCGSRRLWACGGHFGASQVPGWAAVGPGEIDIERLTGRAAHAAVQLSAAGTDQAPPEGAHGGRERERPEQDQWQEQGQRHRQHGERTGLAEFDDIFEHRPAAGSLTRVG